MQKETTEKENNRCKPVQCANTLDLQIWHRMCTPVVGSAQYFKTGHEQKN